MTKASDPATLCEEAKKQPRPIYLLLGESVTTSALAHALIDVLVPSGNRDFNLETYDGRTTRIATVLDSLRMRGLFSGPKVVWLRETTLFLSTEKKGDLTAALLEALEEQRNDEAASRLLTLLAMAGWSEESFESESIDSLPASRVKESFGVELEPTQLRALGALQAYCREKGLVVRDYHDDSEQLLEFLERGIPPGAVLLLTTATADARKRVFKKLQTLDAVTDLRVARERTGAISREGVHELSQRVARDFGLRIEPPALELIVRRSGADPAALLAELEKLCLFVGDRKAITAADVRASFRDMAESWIFDFTSALAAGNVASAVPLLRDLIAQGDHPLRLLAMIAREIRLLLAARDCLDGPLRGSWRRGLSFQTFQSRLQPLLGELGEAAFGKMHPFRVYKYLSDAAGLSTARLRRALVDLSELDFKLKTSRGQPAIMLEAFVLDFCRLRAMATPPQEGPAPAAPR